MRTLILLAATLSLCAQPPAPLSPDGAGLFPIWPGTPPGSENWTWHEVVRNLGRDRMVRNVVTPTLTMYQPVPAKANGASVIIAPGGAFRFLMTDYEGVDMARWLTERGVTAFVLRYRLMHTPEDESAFAAYLQDLFKTLAAGDTRSESPPAFDAATTKAVMLAEEDGRQAIRYVRQHAAEWSLDPHRIGIAGFSAGGGVAVGAAMQHDSASRPDFAAPIYPAYRKGATVPDDAPPLFIAIADDDQLVSPGSSARLYTAWHAAGKPAELHILRRGGHGFGMKIQNQPSDAWIGLFYAWMESSGFLKPSAPAISRIYVFGDSYSDTGAGYLDGDGPTAVAYLAGRLGLPLALPDDPNGNGRSLNFAVSGAQTGRGAGRKVKDALVGRGMVDQVEDFASRVESKAITFDPEHTLFFLAGGLNDRRLPSAETVDHLKGEIRKLYGLGGRRFQLALLPTAIPAFSEVGLRLNPEIEKIPSEIQRELAGARISLSHWGPFLDEVFRNPAAYGIENTKDACAGRAIFNEDAAPCAQPWTHYYYHSGHPSTAVHKVVGDKVYAEIMNAR